MLLEQHIQYLAMLVDRTPQPVCDSMENHAHLVEVPGPTSPWFEVAQRFGEIRTKLGAPDSHRFMTHFDASLEQKLLHIPVREQKTVVEVNSIGDDDFRETLTFRALSWGKHPRSLPLLKIS